MKPKWLLLWSVAIVLALSLVRVTVTSAQSGQARLILINYIGTEMTLTLDGAPYTVPGTDTVPGGGQLTLTVTPGRHAYSAHVPGSEGSNGEVELVAGQTQILGARLERSSPVISPAGVVLEEPRDVLVLFKASLTPPVPSTTPESAPLQPLPTGQGALVFVNYIGEALTVDMGGMLYTVPANGQLQVNSPPGVVSYTASTPLSSMNGTVPVTAGTYTGLGFTREIAPEPDYEVGKPAPTPVPLEMFVFPVPVMAEPITEITTAAPAAVPGARPEPPVSILEDQGTLRVVNYIGETLTLTIDNQAYSIAGSGGTLTIALAPGEYPFTASTPRVGMNSSLRIRAGIATRISVALDVQSEQMKIYIE